ncbi:hypothetical protein CFC21_018894, partial [Triticum aestivum]
GLRLLLRRRAGRRARRARPGRVRALHQAASKGQRHLHVQGGHALLQRRLPTRADAARRRLRQAGGQGVHAGNGVRACTPGVMGGARRELTGDRAKLPTHLSQQDLRARSRRCPCPTDQRGIEETLLC